jgi:hypothetical protein
MDATLNRALSLSEALFLALIAPDDEQAMQASELADNIARGMRPEQVEQAKLWALCRTKAMEN